LIVFVAFFVISFFTLVVFNVRSDPSVIDNEDMVDLYAKVVSLYFIHLSIIITGFFGQEKLKKGRSLQNVFWAALSLSIVWNIMFFWRLVYYCAVATDDIPSIESYISKVTMPTSFLVTGALAYFFTVKGSE
jgi:hypothetical protein